MFLALKEFQNLCANKIVLVVTDNTTVMSYINKEGGMRSGTMCPTMENLDLVYQTSSNSKSPTYPRAAECGSRQAIQAGPDHSNRMVPPSRGFPSYMQQVAPTSEISICHEVQQQVTSVCVTSTGLLGSSSGCTQSAMGESCHGRILCHLKLMWGHLKIKGFIFPILLPLWLENVKLTCCKSWPANI